MKSVHARARTTMKFHTIPRTMRRRALFLWQLGGQMEMMVGYDSCIQSVFHTLVIYSVYIYIYTSSNYASCNTNRIHEYNVNVMQYM